MSRAEPSRWWNSTNGVPAARSTDSKTHYRPPIFKLIGRINVFDLDSIASREKESLQDSFSTVPVGVIGVRGDAVRCVRRNPSYREFVSRYLGIDIQLVTREYARISVPFIDSMIKNCSEEGGRAILDQTMLDGSTVQQVSTNDSDLDSVDLLPTDVHSRRQVLSPPSSMRGRWGAGAGGASSSAQPPLLRARAPLRAETEVSGP